MLESEEKQAKLGHIHFGKDLCPDGFDGKSSEVFKASKPKVVNYLSLDENNRVEEILEWASKLKDKISTEIYNAEAHEEDWDPDNNMTHRKFSNQLYRFLMAKTTDAANRIVQNGDADDGVDAWRRLMFHYEPNLASITQCHLKALLAIPRATGATEAVSNVQRLDDLIRRCEKARNEDLDEELKVQRMFDILPSTIEQHLVLVEHRDKEPTFDDLRKRALTCIMTHTSGKAPIIDSLSETAGPFDDKFRNNEHNFEEAYEGDVMGFEGGAKGGKNGKGGFQGTCWVCNEHGHSAKCVAHVVTKKAKANEVDPRKETSNATPKAPISMSRTRASSKKAADPVLKDNNGEDSNGDHGTHGAKEAKKEAKKVVENSKVARERSEEVTTRPHTGRYHALVRDDDQETINFNVLTAQDLLEMAKIEVKQGESKRNNKWNKEQSATPPAPPKPAPTRRTKKTAANLEEAYNNQHNCTEHNNARKMTSGSASLNINGIIGCNCALKGINVLEKRRDKAIDNVDSAWTPTPRPLVIDSGAAETVIPSDWVANHKVEDSAGWHTGT